VVDAERQPLADADGPGIPWRPVNPAAQRMTSEHRSERMRARAEQVDDWAKRS
jgi:hypothetical protein